jgi:hypothetical protein
MSPLPMFDAPRTSIQDAEEKELRAGGYTYFESVENPRMGGNSCGYL